MPRRHRAAAIAAAATALTVLAGCSSSGDASNSSSASASAGSGGSTSSTPSGSTSSLTSVASSPAGGGLDTALLTASDVGAGFAPTGTSTTDSPLPCTPDTKPLFVQAPPATKVEKSFVNGASTVQVGETLAEYGATGDADQAYTIGEKGFTCGTGSIGGQQVKIVKRAGGAPGGTSGVDEFAAWDFAAGQQKGTAVIVRIKARIVALTFSAVGTAGAKLPVGDIVNRAIARVAALD